MSRSSKLLAPALLIAVALCYYPAWHGGLLWDDDAHITAAALQSLPGLWRIWTDIGATQQYYPVTHSAFWLLHHSFGDATFGYHLVNLALHATSAFLILLVLQRLAVPGALLAAVIFALHPVHVESVAWISELKNTLSTVLYLLALLAYLRFAERRERKFWLTAFALFVLALLAKSVTATLPAVILVIVWWRRGALRWREVVRPLLPFFGVAVAAGLLTAWVERHFIGAQGAEFELSLIERVLLAGRAVFFYLGKLFGPADLSFVYPRWQIDDGQAWQYAFPLALLALIIVFWLLRRRSRAPLAVLLLFCGSLFPALGFIDVFPFRYSFVADHFQYLASIPVIAGVAAALTILAQRVKLNPHALLVLAVPLAVLTWKQSAHYASGERLYRATLEQNPGAWLAHNNLGMMLAIDRRYPEAHAHFTQAVQLNPRIPEHHMNLGRLLIGLDSLNAGIAHLEMALQLDPRLANAHNNIGVARLRQGRLAEAVASFEAALAIDPYHTEASANLFAARQGR